MECWFEFNSTIEPAFLVPALFKPAAQLIIDNPFAFAMAAVIDRGTKAENIWTIPYSLKNEIGSLEPYFFSERTVKDHLR